MGKPMKDNQSKKLSMNADFLEFCYYRFWRQLGASETHSRIVARNISLGDRQEKIYQGMGVLEAVLIPFEGGILDIKATPEMIKEGPTWAVFDGKKSSGHYTVYLMAEKAVEKAREHGIAIAFGHNHNDAGAFFAYTSVALENDMFAMASNNSVPLNAPYGGMDFSMSTPPFDAACPKGEELPLVTSVALCEGYDAHITEALLHDTKLAGKHLVDPETGELTDDVKPYANLIEGYKRVSDCHAPWVFNNPRTYSLNIWTEVLTSIINPMGTIAPELPAIPSEYLKPGAPTPVGGSYIIVIDPSHFGPLQNVKDKSDQFVRAIKNTKKRPGVDEIFIPDEWGLKRLYNKDPEVDILEDHWEAFQDFLIKYDLNLDMLKAEWEELSA
jgi:L-2-hydroxycarboxylate dehydrogenase (NAD+)